MNNKWHSIEIESILEILDSNLDGIDSSDALRRQKEYGLNELPEEKKKTYFQSLVSQFLSPIMIVLLIATIASILIQEYVDASFIFAAILLNAVLGAQQEWNAYKKTDALQNIIKDTAGVKRDGNYYVVNSNELVVGDIITIEAGDTIPADTRIISSYSLTVDESFLTGESSAISKNSEILKQDIEASERTNLLYAGSTILTGKGEGIVVNTGLNTEVGKIASDIAFTKRTKPPLVLRLEKFTKQVGFFVLIIVLILSFILLLQGNNITQVFPFAIVLIISSIPESLPIAVTVVLSIATTRMAKKNVIVKKLEAVESLGSCTVIATDKTGTLTVNQQTAKIILLPDETSYNVSGEGYNGEGLITINNQNLDEDYKEQLKNLITIGSITNEGYLEKENGKWLHYGDSMDVALLSLAYKNNINPLTLKEEYNILDIVPYDSANRLSLAFFKQKNNISVGMKGAVETVINYCETMYINNKQVRINKEKIINQVNDLSAKGYRVLAFASSSIENFNKKDKYSSDDIPPLTFLGLIGFIDPLRKEAKSAVLKCQSAGIKVIMITGDHPATAYSIAKEMDLVSKKSEVITGKELEQVPELKFDDFIKDKIVFARVSPLQKKQIIEALQRNNEYVAVTGDGVNDAPAMKSANIGVAMGSGTDVAINTGSMVITDDNFNSIVAGVEEGRFAYDNIRKVVYLLISTVVAELFILLSSVLLGTALPLIPVQILWLNLVTNGVQDIALAFEPGEDLAMKRPPRKPNESLFNKEMISQTFISGLIIGIISLSTWLFLYNHLQIGITESRSLVLLGLVIMQNVHVFNCRSEVTSVFKMKINSNKALIGGLFLQMSLQILAMYTPFMKKILQVSSPSIKSWIILLLIGLPLLLGMEIFKYFRRKKLIKN